MNDKESIQNIEKVEEKQNVNLELQWENDDQKYLIENLESELNLAQERECCLMDENQKLKNDILAKNDLQDEFDEIRIRIGVSSADSAP